MIAASISAATFVVLILTARMSPTPSARGSCGQRSVAATPYRTLWTQRISLGRTAFRE